MASNARIAFAAVVTAGLAACWYYVQDEGTAPRPPAGPVFAGQPPAYPPRTGPAIRPAPPFAPGPAPGAVVIPGPAPVPGPGPRLQPAPAFAPGVPPPAPVPGPAPGPVAPPGEDPDVVEGPPGVAIHLPPGTVLPGESFGVGVAPSMPDPPEGLAAAGPAYDVVLPDRLAGRDLDAFVRLPLPDPSAASDPAKVILVGRHDGTDWEIVPAEVDGDRAVAPVGHFSRIQVLIGIQRDRPEPGELPNLRIGRPTLWGIRVAGDLATAYLGISDCRTATTGRFFSRNVAVQRLRVYVSRPAPGQSVAGPTQVVPYRRREEEVYLSTEWGAQSIFLDFDMAGTMNIGASDPPWPRHGWWLSLAPVFADGSEGQRSAPIMIPAGAAEAQIKLRQGLIARMDAGQGAAFAEATRNNPYHIFFDSWVISDLYSQATGSIRRRLNAGLWTNDVISFIGLSTGTSEFDRVTCHEWGHYVTNLTLGDAAFAALPGGSHSGWAQAASRGLAWSEDLATFLGQYGTGAGVPPDAGAMRGRLNDFSRRSEGENNAGSRWPNNRSMDAPAVECLPATILSRVAGLYGFARVYGLLLDRKPRDVLDFFAAWNEGDRAPLEELAAFQKIYLDEGVAWRMKGRIVGRPDRDGDEPIPLEGAEVMPQTFTGENLAPSPIRTGADGGFEVVLPPQSVQFRVVKEGWEPTEDFHAYLGRDVTGASTLAPPQQMPPFQMKRTGPPPEAVPDAGAADAPCPSECEEACPTPEYPDMRCESADESCINGSCEYHCCWGFDGASCGRPVVPNSTTVVGEGEFVFCGCVEGYRDVRDRCCSELLRCEPE